MKKEVRNLYRKGEGKERKKEKRKEKKERKW